MGSFNTECAEKYLDGIDKSDFYKLEGKLGDPDIIYYSTLCEISKKLAEDVEGAEEGEECLAKAIAIIAHIAYGWMPKMLSTFKDKADEEDKKEYMSIIRRAVDITDEADGKDLICCIGEGKKPPINNSWVGLSKVLHLINPCIFPIWDSRVAKKFKVSISYSSNTAKDQYLRYFQFIHQYKKRDIVSEFINYLEKRECPPDRKIKFSRVRALEFLFYATEEKNECNECKDD